MIKQSGRKEEVHKEELQKDEEVERRKVIDQGRIQSTSQSPQTLTFTVHKRSHMWKDASGVCLRYFHTAFLMMMIAFAGLNARVSTIECDRQRSKCANSEKIETIFFVRVVRQFKFF